MHELSPLSLILISFGIVALMAILFIVLNVRLQCPSGSYSFDGKGSAMNPCTSCNSLDGSLDTLKKFPTGSYQCDLGRFDDNVERALDDVIGVVNDPSSLMNLVPISRSEDLNDMSSEEFARRLFAKR